MDHQEKPLLARVRKPKEPLHLVHQTTEAEAAKAVILPPLSDDERLERKGQEVTRKATAAYMVAAEVYHQIFAQKLFERRGMVHPGPYFETTIGVAWRTAQQGIYIWEAYLSLPEDARPAARLVFEEVGIYKAALVAPAIREHPEQWAEWTSLAADRTVSREALQERVSKARGLPPANSKKAGDRLYGAFMSLLDKDRREEAETIIKAGMRVGETSDFFVVMYLALIEAAPSWIAQADRIQKGHGNA